MNQLGGQSGGVAAGQVGTAKKSANYDVIDVIGVLDQGRLVQVADRGRGYDHVISCGSAVLTCVFAAWAGIRGTSVRWTLDPAGCLAFPLAHSSRYDSGITTVTSVAVTAGTH